MIFVLPGNSFAPVLPKGVFKVGWLWSIRYALKLEVPHMILFVFEQTVNILMLRLSSRQPVILEKF